MYVTVVYVQVKQQHIDDFIKATQKNHMASVQEPGNCRFDVLQDGEDPCKFVLYEAYATAGDAAAHKNTQHYLTWRETVADMMAQSRKGIRYDGLFPGG